MPPTLPKARPAVQSTWLALAVALFLVATGNLAALRTILDRGVEQVTPLLLMAALAAATFNLLVLELAAMVRLLKWAAVGLLMVTAISSYFLDTFGLLIDKDMITNVAQTDSGEVYELLTWPLFLRVGLLGILPAVVVLRLRVRYAPPLKEAARSLLVVTAALVVLGGTVASQYKTVSLFVRENRDLRWKLNPSAPIIATLAVVQELTATPTPMRAIAMDALPRSAGKVGEKRRLVIFVLGETATASHFSLNGYPRETNSGLKERDVFNFPDVHSCGTSTAQSLPCMFSAKPREEYSRKSARNAENVLDVLQRCGIEVLWRENNSGCKGVCDRIPHENVGSLGADPALVSTFGWYDEALLHGLQPYVDTHPGDLFIVLHQEGSHGPAYFKRTPPAFKQFLPECARDDVQNCSREDLVNAYDNTILYTDHVLSQVIDFLQANDDTSCGVMVYVSDHGESLGENGVYLHGFPYWMAPEEQIHVPMVVWMSPSCDEDLGVDRSTLETSRNWPISHDNLFHSFLGIFDITTSLYDPQLDIFAPARWR